MRTPSWRTARSTSCSRRAASTREEEPDQTLVGIVETARREVQQAAALKRAGLSDTEVRQALNPPALKVTTVEPVDPEADRKGTFAFIAVLALYAQLLTFGYLLASGVVEEKASRVVEVLLATIRPRDLLAGKIIGLGVLGFGQTLIIAAAGLAAATATGALEVDSDIVVAAALAVGWFVLGYAFYAGLFACAGALVPRQEELQSSMTPLTMMILFSFFVSFAVLDNPDGTLARVTSFIPFSAPMIMPRPDRARRGLDRGDRRRLRDHRGVRRRADPDRRPDLQRRRPAHRLLREAPRRLGRRASPRLEPELDLAGDRRGRDGLVLDLDSGSGSGVA